MAVVELSAGIMSGLPARLVWPTTANCTTTGSSNFYNWIPLLPYNFYIGGYQGSASYQTTGTINVYQGTVPSDLSTLTAYNSRSADVLVIFNCTSPGLYTSTINVSVNPAFISTAYTNATATGTATWFRWYTYNSSQDSPQFQIMHQIIGTVGATGSGADLEISSTSIVSGRAYRIQTLRIQFPSSFTYT